MNNRNELVRRLLSGITTSELQNLVHIRESANQRPSPTPRTRHKQRVPLPTPRRNVQQLIQHFEKNPFLPYRPIPAPRTKKQQPVAAPRTKIIEKRKALRGYKESFETLFKNDRDPLIRLQNTRLGISRLFGTTLNNTRGFKYVEAYLRREKMMHTSVWIFKNVARVISSAF